MCVIAVKKRGVDFPKDESVKAMWDTNSDGAGFMYALNDKVYIEKGFMKLSDFQNAITSLGQLLSKKKMTLNDIPMVLHFRITTHGGTSPQLTHPFPISSQETHLKALDLSCNLGLVHNGIISSVATKTGLSDTATYIADILTPLAYLNKNFYKTKEGKALIENTIGASKFTFLDKDGNIELIGDFKSGTKNETEGILFSNLSHEFEYSAGAHGLYGYGGNWRGYYADDGYTAEDFNVKETLVKRLPAGTMVVNDKFFEDTQNTGKYEKILTDSDKFYIDKYDTIYIETKNGYLIENTFYEMVVVVKDDMYVMGGSDDFDSIKAERKEIL